jgi:hypothetical protein
MPRRVLWSNVLPTAGDGIPADAESVCVAVVGVTPSVHVKTGEGDNAWTDIGSGIAFNGTEGSIPYVNADGRLTEDNDLLFFKDDTGTLAVGGNALVDYGWAADTAAAFHRTDRHSFLSVVTIAPAKDAGLIFGTLALPFDAAIFLDESDGQKLKFAIGAVSVDADRNTNTAFSIHQDKKVVMGSDATANATWNDASKYLTLVSSALTDGPLFVRNTTSTGVSALGTLDTAGAFKAYWGWFSASYAFAYLRSKHGVLCNDNANFVLGNSTVAQFEFGMTAASAYMEFASGNSAAVSPAGKARIRWNAGLNKLQVSENGGAYANII